MRFVESIANAGARECPHKSFPSLSHSGPRPGREFSEKQVTWKDTVVSSYLTCFLSPFFPHFLCLLPYGCHYLCGPVIGKYSQHPDSGEPQMLMPCASSSLYCIQMGIFINTHGPVVSLSSLSPPPPYSPRVAAEVGRRLDTISIHLCSLLPLASRKSGSFPRLHPAFLHALTSSPGTGSQHGPLASAHSEQFVYGQCLSGIRKPRSGGGLTDRAARESCCPPL